ncbi:hypothetical protein [Leuconostoc citreum]|uniref:hypothetical protein n=1 Tax=Leuconostoc citreum TaxID=33964 RepID=UPI0032DFC22D
MFNRKKKTNIDEPYFARIDNNALDFDQEIVQKAAENAGGFIETYPNVSLQDLQAFLAQVTNDVVRAGNQDVRLGTISYLTQDDKGHAEPTGLSWDEAILTADFENIVVSTANHVFNDESVRQDETIDHDMIEDALQPLVNAALMSTTLTDQDMPLLPSPDAYQQARELGESITIEATRFQRVVPQPVAPEVTELEKTPVVAEETPSVPVVPVIAEQKGNQVDNGEENGVKTPDDNRTPEKIDFSSEQQLIDEIDIRPKAFPIDGETKVLPAESDNYVQARLNADKLKANRFLNDTSLLYTQKVRKALSEYLKTNQVKLAEEVTSIQQTDVLATVTAQLAGERPEEFETRYDMRKKAREAGYQAEISEENQRHEQKVSSLKADYVKDLEELKVSINQELDDWYLKRTQTMKQSVESSLVNQINDKQTQAKESLITGLKALRDELLTEHSHSMIALQEQLTQDIEKNRDTYKQEHDAAILQATKLASAQAQSAHLGELQAQISALETSKRELKQTLETQKQSAEATVKALSDEKESLLASASELKQRVALTQTTGTAKQADVNQQLMSLLTAQLQANKAGTQTSEKPVPKRQSSGALSAFAIGSLSALLIGGTAYGAYAYGHQSSSSQAKSVQGQSSTASNTFQLGTANKSTQDGGGTKPLNERYQVGDEVKAMIDGKQVMAKVSSVANDQLKLSYNGQDYQVKVNQ